MYKILLGIFFLLFSPSFSYAGQYVFTHYSSKDGLSSNYIHDIAQDRNGFIWIATHFGISRFNGTTFHNFLSTDYPSMYRDDIYHAFVMKHGAVTFGSSKGTIVSYNNRQDNFTDYAPTDSFYHDITGYTLCLDGEELVSTSAGVYTYCENAGKLQFLPVVPKGTAVYEVFKDHWQHYWLGLNRGVALYNRTGEKVNGFEAFERINEQINNICQLDKNTLLLCSTTGSLWRVTCTEDGQMQELKKIDTPFKNISEICTDNADIWIGTSGSGLWKGISQNGTFSFERCMPINRDDSDVRKISALYKDADGNIWVGTQNTGLWCITPARQSAVTISSDLGIPMVTGTSFYENSRKEILLGTDGQGLFLLDSLYNIKQHLTDNERLSANSILSITPFNDKCVLSYWGGEISQLDPVFLQNKKLPFLGIDHPSQTAKFATTAPNGEIWACMSGDGVYVHKAGKGWSKLHLMNDKWVNHVCFSKQAAWVTTTRTIWRIDKDGQCTALFPDTEKEPTHNPTELHQCAVDEQGNCYAATSNGIYHCPANGNRFEKLDFLPQGVYSSILYDQDGQFWTSGTNGILTFKAKEQTYCHELDALSGYDQNFYIPRAIYKDHHNQFFLGTKQGFVVLNNSIKNTPTSPYTEWSELYSRGTKVSVNSSGLLPVSLSSTHQLEIAYNQTDIGLKYDIVNLKANNPIKAFYRINGLDTTWVPVGSDQTIKITHLPEGDYLLEVQFFSKGRQLPNSRLQMGILVSPPWWRTWWFYTLLALSIAASALLYFRRHIRNITRQKKELEQKVAERTLELSEANLSLQQREKEVELQNELLHNALKEKDQLVSIVGHDLKNPMFSIVSTLEHLLRDKEEKDNPLLRQVFHAAAVLQGQLLKLLDWANENRITATCDIRQTDINEIMAEVSAQARGMLEDKKINLNTHSDVTHYVLADPRMLSTIIRNLLTNAIKFSPEGSPILLKAVETDELVRVSVCDKGIGMSEDTIEKLRNGMRTTSLGTSSEKGYGLGFGIIREFVKQNKGTLNIKSAPGEGTTIEIDFLRTEQTLEKKANHLPEAPKPAIEADKELLAGKTILVVDDDPLILLHLKALLSKFVNVLTADNGEDGLLLAKNNIPDLILSDVDMPKMNGMEMFDAIKENSVTSNVPFLFISAINEEALRIRGLSRGAIDYIPKPFNEQEIIMKVCNVLSVLKKQQLSVLLKAMNGEEQKKEEVNPLLDQLLDVVKEHYQEPGYSFDDIASALGLSKSTLTRRLKSLTDKSPVEILSDYRLNKAKQLLLSGSETVSDVAYAVGFNDPLYFSKKFKEAFGCPPSKIK
ncbi:MAG: response regulator [Paludibacteraceae bacterium]|nr:response regulator [Paludibacteraceae bacterium]